MVNDNSFQIIKNVFSREIVDLLYISCKKNFVYNVQTCDKIINTNCIVDCHGLALSPNVVFPYYEYQWNVFCMTIKKILIEYTKLNSMDSSLLIPHSCWAERSLDWNLHNKDEFRVNVYKDSFKKNKDHWLENYLKVDCPMIRVVYFLKNPDPKYGVMFYDGVKTHSLPGEENSLLIYQCREIYSSNKFPTDSENKYNIIFDWYLHKPGAFKRPTWFLPNLDDEDFKTQIKKWWNNDYFTNSRKNGGNY